MTGGMTAEVPIVTGEVLMMIGARRVTNKSEAPTIVEGTVAATRLIPASRPQERGRGKGFEAAVRGRSDSNRQVCVPGGWYWTRQAWVPGGL